MPLLHMSTQRPGMSLHVISLPCISAASGQTGVNVKRPGYGYEAMTNPHSKLMMTYHPCTPYKLIFCCVRCEDIWGVCVRVCTGGKRVWGGGM